MSTIDQDDVRDAIRAAALAGHYQLAGELALQFRLNVCLQCAHEVQYEVDRLSLWQHWINSWGWVCPTCLPNLRRTPANSSIEIQDFVFRNPLKSP